MIQRFKTSLLEDGPVERQFAEDFNQRSGLTFVVKAGIFVDTITVTNIPETTLSLTDDATNVIFLDVTDLTVKAVTLGSEPGIDMIPLFQVVTVSAAITTVADNRKIITRFQES